MSRRTEYTLAFDAPPEKMYQDFTSREYWQSLMDSYRLIAPQTHSELTSLRPARAAPTSSSFR